MQLPLTLRILYHGFRATLRAGLVFFLAWLLLIPANAKERAALGASVGTSYPDGLRIMRAAQVVSLLAPPQAYALVARAWGENQSGEDVQARIKDVAAGEFVVNAPEEPFSAREIEGPRFIRVD